MLITYGKSLPVHDGKLFIEHNANIGNHGDKDMFISFNHKSYLLHKRITWNILTAIEWSRTQISSNLENVYMIMALWTYEN